ncbi:MAG: site-specific DNA-methyltransferase [candidate division Zixibacteria bacterium]|nr:site-specific DNA-methyltransferase [candidate division Zixibacteria bacterium]
MTIEIINTGVNKIYCEDCLDTMSRMPDNFIDLTVTSPPYDNLRAYRGYSFDFENIAQELYRVTNCGGVVVWVVGDATIRGSETGTSFKQALYFKEIGFNLHDTMIYQKSGAGAVGSNKCYLQNFEYMFIFTKGKINTFNLIHDRKNKRVGSMLTNTKRCNHTVETGRKHRRITAKEYGKRFNLWKYATGKNTTSKDKVAFNHPAVFPEQLVNDHIISWSNKGDLIYDPFMGSGTTAKMAVLNNRCYIGSEVSEKYCGIIETRIKGIRGC